MVFAGTVESDQWRWQEHSEPSAESEGGAGGRQGTRDAVDRDKIRSYSVEMFKRGPRDPFVLELGVPNKF